MRDVPANIASAWSDGLFIGDRKPTVRVTVVHPQMYLRNYSLMSTFTEHVKVDPKTQAVTVTIDNKKGHRVKQSYADLLFTKLHTPLEMPNIKSVSWQRSIDSDVADCTIEAINTKALEVGDTVLKEDLDQPGYYTYSRGGVKFRTAWGHQRNQFFGMVVPDNIIRTYEGYGADFSVCPEKDPNLVQTGVWMVDSVTMSSTGNMSIKCRDIGRILLDQIYYEPVVPTDFYDIGFTNWDGDFPGTPATNKLKLTAQDSSNTSWIGGKAIAGHSLKDAFDGDPNTYWLSIGNVSPSKRFAYEWVQAGTGSKSVSTVKFRTKKKGYTYYISLKVGGVWQGKNLINYHQDNVGHNGGNIKYVATGTVDTEGFVTVKLPKAVAKVQAVRITLGNLQNFRIGTYKYRAGIRDIEVYGTTISKSSKYKKGPAGANPGKYDDYTDIVKLLCAWGGFFWPAGGRQRYSDGTFHNLAPAKYDWKVLGNGVKGRVWGDFEQTGTSGPAELDRSNFDKKPLMDGIAYIKDIIGFLFFIDESGGVQWRLPNVYNFGSRRSYLSAKPGYSKKDVHVLDERSVLLDLSATVDSKNVRESFFVGDIDGKVGAYAPGFNPNPIGLRRMAGWLDQNFGTYAYSEADVAKDQKDAFAQCQMMADMLSLRQLFTYRTDRVRIPANPAIQIDDQVRITERVTAEGYIHYVKGIASSLDMESGQWTYDLDTHWLGSDPETLWLFKVKDLTPPGKTHVEKLKKSQLKTLEDLLIRAKAVES